MTLPAHDPLAFNMAAYVLGAGGASAESSALEVYYADRVETLSYGDLRASVAGIAAGMLDRGLIPGDRVLLRLGNTVSFPLAYLGAQWAGLVPVPTSAALTAREISKMAAMVAPKAVISAPGIALPDSPAQVITETDLLAWRVYPGQPAHLGQANRLGYIVFTSGSGGVAKPVAHAHRAILARAMMWEGWYALRQTDRLLHAGAFNWTYTLGTGLMDPWSIGATALITAPGTPTTDLGEVLARARASLFAAAPGVFRQMLRAPRPPLPYLRHGLSAGEALPEITRTRWRAETGTQIHEALGMSECSTFISGSPNRPATKGTTGFPQKGRRIAVLDDQGRQTTTGSLAVHRDDPGLMLGYWEDGRPHLPLTGDWFDTGDQVSQAADGAVTYLGRDDEMMNAGGFRVSPLEVEAALRPCPGLTEIAVTEVRARPDKTLIAAFFSGTCALEILQSQAEATLASYKRPHLWVPMETLPHTATGKLNRKALRDGNQWRQHLRPER